MKYIHKIAWITTALAIACIFIIAAIADDSAQKAKELFSRGVEASDAQKYEEAIKYFEAVLKINPDYAETYNNLGVAYVKLGRHTVAMEAYKKAIRIDPDYAEAHYNMGVAYVISGNREAALAEYEIITGLDSDLANELFNLIYK